MGGEKSRREIAMGKLFALLFALMAAIPLLIGAVIFAPVFIALALFCMCRETDT